MLMFCLESAYTKKDPTAVNSRVIRTKRPDKGLAHMSFEIDFPFELWRAQGKSIFLC